MSVIEKIILTYEYRVNGWVVKIFDEENKLIERDHSKLQEHLSFISKDWLEEMGFDEDDEVDLPPEEYLLEPDDIEIAAAKSLGLSKDCEVYFDYSSDC